MNTDKTDGRSAAPEEHGTSAGSLTRHLTKETELWARRDTDPRAREELVNRYLPFARRLASRYRNNYESFDDLLQVASVGLVNAINRYDPDNGSPFTAFASPTIQGELKRYFRDRVWLVRVPRGIQEEIQAVDRAAEELAAELHRDATAEELGERANLDTQRVQDALLAKKERNPVAFELPADEEGSPGGERFGREDPGYKLLEDSDEIRRSMEKLGDTERLVLRLRFIEDMTQTEIAERIGCSQMHVSRLLRRSLATLMADSDIE
jgi:RNA polymerase sigma-B factor